MATHSSVLAWRIPGTGEPGGLPSVGSHRVGHDRSDLAAAAAEMGTEPTKLIIYPIALIMHINMPSRWRNSGNSGRLYFGGLQNHCRW